MFKARAVLELNIGLRLWQFEPSAASPYKNNRWPIFPSTVRASYSKISKSVLSINTNSGRKALATSLREVGYFFPLI